MFVTSYSVTYWIYVPGKPGICFHYYCCVYDECKYSNTFWLADRTRLVVQYTIVLSSLCKLIWRHWTYKMPVRYILSSVWVRLSIFSPLSIIQLPIPPVMIEIIYILYLVIIIKSEVWTITHCLGLGMCAECLSIFLLNQDPKYHLIWTEITALKVNSLHKHHLKIIQIYIQQQGHLFMCAMHTNSIPSVSISFDVPTRVEIIPIFTIATVNDALNGVGFELLLKDVPSSTAKFWEICTYLSYKVQN